MAINQFQQVITYNKSALARLLNSSVYIHESNKKYQELDKIPKNLGDTVSFTKPYRARSKDTLAATFSDTKQEVDFLTIDKQASHAFAFDTSQFILSAREFMEEYGSASIAEIGYRVERDLAQVNVQSPFRFYGDGTTTLLNSFQQLKQMLAYFRNYGAARTDTVAIVPDLSTPRIIGSGLSEFVLDRNEKLAMSWKLGEFANCRWAESNLLPIHIAGNVGQNATELTLTAVNDITGANVTQLTFSGAGISDPDAFKENDLIQFIDTGIAPLPILRYLTYTGYEISGNPVQCRVTADAASDGAGNVTVNIFPPLNWVATSAQQNISETTPLYDGAIKPYKVKAVNSHRAGVVYSGRALFLAMPQQCDLEPFPSSNIVDKETGATIRSYYGAQIFTGSAPAKGFANDVIWGKRLVPEYAMRLCFPIE